MPRPPEYENFIKRGWFEDVAQTEGAVAGFLKNAAEDLEVARSLEPKRAKQRFTLAYEGFYGLVQAILEHHGVRTKDAGRNMAIQRVAHDLGLSAEEFALVTAAHARRNETTYRSPFPPISRAEAQALVDILAKCLPLAHTLTGVAAPAPAAGAPGKPAGKSA